MKDTGSPRLRELLFDHIHSFHSLENRFIKSATRYMFQKASHVSSLVRRVQTYYLLYGFVLQVSAMSSTVQDLYRAVYLRGTTLARSVA